MNNSNIPHATNTSYSFTKMKHTVDIYNITPNTTISQRVSNTFLNTAATGTSKKSMDVRSRTESIDGGTVTCGRNVLVGCEGSSTIKIFTALTKRWNDSHIPNTTNNKCSLNKMKRSIDDEKNTSSTTQSKRGSNGSRYTAVKTTSNKFIYDPFNEELDGGAVTCDTKHTRSCKESSNHPLLKVPT